LIGASCYSMQNFLEFSKVVDGVRSSAGSALKSVQHTFEEQALKAAGLGEDEEVLYRLNKHAQAYLRAADAMQQAAEKLAQDFADALEDIALRDIARKFRESSGFINAQRQTDLKGFADPVRQACEADNVARRQQLVYKAFDHLLKVDSEICGAIGKLDGEVRDSAQKAFNSLEQPKVVAATSPVKREPAAPSPQAPVRTSPHREEAKVKVALSPPPASFDDLLGDSKGNADLLDFGFDSKPSAINSSSGCSTAGGYGTSSPLEHVSFGFDVGDSAKRPSTASFDIGLDSFDILNGTAPSASLPSVSPPVDDLGLGGLSWTSKEDEDESCIQARVDYWKRDKNLKTMLVTLHEVAPSSSKWTAVKLDDVATSANVKDVYRKAMLAVHPDKNQGKPGEKLIAHFVFQALREQWTIFNTSS